MTTLTPAGEKLLAAASTLFYRRGIRAVGVDLIAETAGTTKKTLYDRFGSKDALVALYLERRAAYWQGFLLDRMAGRTLVEVFDVLALWLADQDRGCAFVNAYAEIGGTDHPAEPVIRAEKEWMRAYLVDLARAAGLPDRLGIELHLLYEGATVMATAGGVPEAPALAKAAAERAVSACGSAPTSG
ncbi:TetR/AcrR family transcriptional regulator [Pseudonocardia pini]|uniref:TetR/AcrR family transcriptional regulator n=1 Tax=Pseudonocardia pini TaxID=2758030 RepID=UPI0015EFFBFA|nr:TetR/AcrR family transcriptional regulator [Pseudonocardia pini]